MPHSISVSGVYTNNLFRIETTLLTSKELKFIKGYMAYDVTIVSKTPKGTVNASDFSFSLLCNEEMIEAVNVSNDANLLQIINDYRKISEIRESILVLFPETPMVHYNYTQMVFCYNGNLFSSFELKY